jgi:hypothetical protein
MNIAATAPINPIPPVAWSFDAAPVKTAGVFPVLLAEGVTLFPTLKVPLLALTGLLEDMLVMRVLDAGTVGLLVDIVFPGAEALGPLLTVMILVS